MERYDAAVIGTGPAGLAAALNLAIREKQFLLFGNRRLSSKVEVSPKIDNYLGLPNVTGPELQRRFSEHLAAMGISIEESQVSLVYPMGDYFSIATNKETYEASTVILAPGTAPARLLPGEERLLGKGVGYCATCDAPLYKGKKVAVIGWSDEAVHEANFIGELAAVVYYMHMRKSQIPLREGILALKGPPLEILGDQKVEALRAGEQTVAVDGVFLLRESIAPASLVPGIATEAGYIRVDGEMRTNLPGCFAAGDCTGKPHQLLRAAGQGQTAALAAVAYLDARIV